MSDKAQIIDKVYEDLVYIFGSERKAFEAILGHYLRSLMLLLPQSMPEEKVKGAQTTADLCTLWLDNRIINSPPNEFDEPAQLVNEADLELEEAETNGIR